jgi:hypothetical protein
MPLWYDLEDTDGYLYYYTTREAALEGFFGAALSSRHGAPGRAI